MGGDPRPGLTLPMVTLNNGSRTGMWRCGFEAQVVPGAQCRRLLLTPGHELLLPFGRTEVRPLVRTKVRPLIRTRAASLQG